MSKSLSSKNKVVIASAGSGKTTHIVEQALSLKDKRILITTYTNENLEQIKSYFIEINGSIPKNVSILSWYSFMLQDGIRPYQSLVTTRPRINNIAFGEIPFNIQRQSKADFDKYFLTIGDNVYCDRVTDFVCCCDDKSGGLILKRLEKVYDQIFIDEVQDVSGYDLTFLEKLFESNIAVTIVGDPRQATFSTNNSLKNKKYKKSQIFEWIVEKRNKGLLEIEERNTCHRCNQAICDFADALFPKLPKTVSKNAYSTGHDGIFQIAEAEVVEYHLKYKPVVLRYSKVAKTKDLPALNIGLSKGRTYDRVLIFPTKPMMEYLKTQDLSSAGDVSKLYVAVTRAKHSVAFVIKN